MNAVQLAPFVDEDEYVEYRVFHKPWCKHTPRNGRGICNCDGKMARVLEDGTIVDPKDDCDG